MDGGAYCTLTPVVLSRGTLHAGGPYAARTFASRGRAMATNTPPNGAFRGFGAPQTEFAAEMQVNRIAEALDMSPLELRRRWVYAEGDDDADRPGPARERRRRGGAREQPRRRRSSNAHRERTRTAREAARDRPARGPRCRASAWRWPGTAPASPAAARSSWPASRRIELTDDAPHPRPDRVDRDGPGHQDDLSAARRRDAGRRVRRGRDRAAGHLDRAGLRPHRRQPHGDGRGWAADQGRASGCAPQVEEETGRSVRRRLSPRRGRVRVDEQFEPYPGVDFDDKTYTRRRLPRLRLGVRRGARSTWTWTPAR